MKSKMYFASNTNKNGNTYQTIIDNDNKTIRKGYFLFRWKDQITMPKAKIKQMIEQYKQQGYKEVED